VPDERDGVRWRRALERLATTPCVVVGRAGWPDADGDAWELVDAVTPDEASEDAIVETVTQAPIASAALAVLLRAAPSRTVAEGLAAESALYSALQAGPEHAAWRRATPVRRRAPSDGPAVVVERTGDELHIELARPEVRNALGVDVRDGLLAALAIADADATLQVVLSGRGPAFCAGGDLDEFGTAPDPATAHLIRLDRSIGAVLARLADRVTVHLHGACYGSGIELAAFAGRVVAEADTMIALPELGLGLVPGAGGTVSLPARIGRHATALLALRRMPVDAATAQAWGLIDERPGSPTI
jgi:enoyl-CoA hydratase/carnithine racemase